MRKYYNGTYFHEETQIKQREFNKLVLGHVDSGGDGIELQQFKLLTTTNNYNRLIQWKEK